MVALAGVATACGEARSRSTDVHTTEALRLANLHAFARLYGVVRWFHPSDAAAGADWDQIAMDGVHAVSDAPDVSALRARIERLIAPIAPTVRMALNGQEPEDAPALHPRNTAGLEVVAWQHEGFGDTVLPAGGYVSKRLHRDREVLAGDADAAFLALSQAVDAAPYRGGQIRLRGKLRVASHAQGRLWLRVENAQHTTFFENMEHRPVLDPHWRDVEIVAPVAADATRIVFGIIRKGRGRSWYDDLDLAAQGKDGRWTSIAISDRGFESGDPLQAWRPGVGRAGQEMTTAGWQVILDHADPATGQAALRIAPEMKLITSELFSRTPAGGETAELDLGRGLRARVPIALYSSQHHTLGDALATSSASSEPGPIGDGFDVSRGVADVIVVWNVFQHFWPYWDLVDAHWSDALDAALRTAWTDRSVDQHVATLERLLAAAPDGHVQVSCVGETERMGAPVAFTMAEGAVVVIASEDASVARGDVVEAIDGRPIEAELASLERQVSGSPQLRRVLALYRLGLGAPGSEVRLRVRRAGQALDVKLHRAELEGRTPPRFAAIERLPDGVYYVDLERVSMTEIDATIQALAAAPGIVFDLRQRPRADLDRLLSHLLVAPDTTLFEHIPRILRPDSASHPAEWKSSGDQLPVLAPHLPGKIAFLIGPETVSYAESLAGHVAYHKLGALIGSPTAGVNGSVAMIATPSGCSVRFTAARVTRPDGGRFHLIGIQPTIAVAPTIAGVAAGRDEVLERGLAYVRATGN
ncbi:MAG TPA: S41 family peptidase [Kofleriaceae bacterium]|nr:S41 family peptidase [Kofleriaceae bacterium]